MSYAIILFAFLCGFAMDLVWTLAIDAIQMRRPIMAANMSALIYLCTVVSTVLIVEKAASAVVAYIIGGWVGTYVIVRWRTRQSVSTPSSSTNK